MILINNKTFWEFTAALIRDKKIITKERVDERNERIEETKSNKSREEKKMKEM